MKHIDVFLLCRLYTHKIYGYSSKAWNNRQLQEEDFIARNNKDSEYDYIFNEIIPHQGEHNLVHNPARGERPWYSNAWVMYVMDLLVLGWIPKGLFDKNSTKVEFTLEKYIIE